MIVHTVKSFSKAIRFGSKYVYETVPRLLTLWLDMGEDRTLQSTDQFQAVNTEIKKAILHTPVYKVSVVGISTSTSSDPPSGSGLQRSLKLLHELVTAIMTSTK